MDDWAGCEFNPAKLDLFGADKAIMSGLVLLFNVSDTSMIFQIESLSQKIVEVAMDWIRDSKKRVIPSHLKVAY